MVEDVVKVLDHIMKWERVNVYSAYKEFPIRPQISKFGSFYTVQAIQIIAL